MSSDYYGFIAGELADLGRQESAAEAAYRTAGTTRRRPCCDHCNNREGDPAGHDYGDEEAHDGPCPECLTGEYLAAEASRSGEE